LKKVRNIILIILGIVLFLNILVVVLLNIPAVQQKIVNIVLNEVQKKIDTDVSIGRIHLNLFKGLILEDIYVADQKGDTLLYVSSLSARFSPLQVYRNNTLRLNHVSLENFNIYLNKETAESPFNYQFIIEAFSSADTLVKDTTPSTFDLILRNVELVNGTFKYDIFSEAEKEGQFNPSHIFIRNLNGELSLGSIQMDKISAEIYHLSAREKSGSELTDLKGKIKNRNKRIQLDDFQMELPQSYLSLSEVWLDYSNVPSNDTLFMTNADYNLKINHSEIVPYDVRAFLPALASLTEKLQIEGSLHNTISSLNIEDLDVSYGNDLSLSLSGFMSDWYNYKTSTYRLDISHLFISANGVTTIEKISNNRFPEIVANLGPANLQLKANGPLSDINLEGTISTRPGSLKIKGKAGYAPDVNGISADAIIQTESFDLNAVLDTSLHLGRTGLDMHVFVSMADGKEPVIKANGEIPFLTYQKYIYRDIKLNGAYYGKNGMNAEIALRDTNINLYINGKTHHLANNTPEYLLQATIRNFNPHNLNLTQDFENSNIGADINVKIRGDIPQNWIGFARIDSLDITMDTTNLYIDSILVTFDKNENKESLIALTSPFISGHLTGSFNFTTIVQSAQNILHPYLPTFISYKGSAATEIQNNFSMNLTIRNTQKLTNVFHLPVTNYDTASITGEFREDRQEIKLDAKFPHLTYGNIPIKDVTMLIGKQNNMYVADLHALLHLENQHPMDISLNMELEKDVVLVDLKYNNSPADFLLKGELKSLVSFKKETNSNDVIITANFLPSDLTVNELTVEFEPAVIVMESGKIHISDFGLIQQDTLFLSVDGTISDSNADTLLVSFKNASITNIMGGLNLTSIRINGYLDGDIYLSGLLGSMRFHTRDFHVNDIIYESENLGTLTLNSLWSDTRQGMVISATLLREGEETSTARGFISPVRDIINFNIKLNMLPVNIAEIFLEGIVHNLSGYVGADLKASGKLSSPDIIGYIYLKDASATINYTDVTYRLSDSITFTPTKMEIKDLVIYDNNNRTATINCTVNHNNFSNFSYNASLRMNNFLLVNNPTKTDSLFYGTFTANGNLTARGNMENLSVNGNISNGRTATLTIRLPESVTRAQTYSTIVYVDHDTLPPPDIKKNKGMSIKANVAAEITKDATFGVIINVGTGDEVVAKGNGNINMEYDSDADIRLFGQYVIDEGHLRIKLSQLPSKYFTIQQGSRVILNGDPMSTNFDITATYRLRADLTTLDASFATLGLSSTRIPVECILQVQGNLNAMNLKYDITLPDSNEEMNRIVSSIINTDDMRIKQFAYLIAFGSFFPPNNQATPGGNLFTSLASSSLSSVLNSALSSVLGNRWTIGTDVSSTQEDFSDMEVNVSLSTQFFNNRLILNTNLGYRSNATTMDESPWIGDFDVEYKLIKSGMLRARVYNYTNNEIFRTANTTQGLGVVFTKEGKTFRDLLRFRKKKENEQVIENPIQENK
jgi:hypothetical protein